MRIMEMDRRHVKRKKAEGKDRFRKYTKEGWQKSGAKKAGEEHEKKEERKKLEGMKM